VNPSVHLARVPGTYQTWYSAPSTGLPTPVSPIGVRYLATGVVCNLQLALATVPGSRYSTWPVLFYQDYDVVKLSLLNFSRLHFHLLLIIPRSLLLIV